MQQSNTSVRVAAWVSWHLLGAIGLGGFVSVATQVGKLPSLMPLVATYVMMLCGACLFAFFQVLAFSALGHGVFVRMLQPTAIIWGLGALASVYAGLWILAVVGVIAAYVQSVKLCDAAWLMSASVGALVGLGGAYVWAGATEATTFQLILIGTMLYALVTSVTASELGHDPKPVFQPVVIMHAQTQRGFTLLELAVVLGIVGALSAAAAPNLMGTRTGMRNKNAAAGVAAMMRQAKQSAMLNNATFALIVRTNTTTAATDDVVALVRCPSTTTAAYNFTSISDDMLKGKAALPTGFSLAQQLELTPDVGFGPGSQGVIAMNRPYDKVPRASGCSFCSGTGGAVVFQNDGTITFSSGSAPLTVTSGSLTASVAKYWPSPSSSHMYTVSLMAVTGEARVWH